MAKKNLAPVFSHIPVFPSPSAPDAVPRPRLFRINLWLLLKGCSFTFVDARFQKRFNLPDGGRLIVTAPWGDKTEVECRYIDKYHVVVGFSAVHVYEYAKGMEKDGYTFEPKQEEPEKMDKKKDQNTHVFLYLSENHTTSRLLPKKQHPETVLQTLSFPCALSRVRIVPNAVHQ